MKSEMEIPQNRDREWKVKWKCLEIEIEKWNFSRILEKFLRIKKSRKITKLLLQNTTKSYSWTNIFHDKMQSYMHNFTLFSREKEWNLKCFHSFREMKSEIIFPFTHSENEKWNENALRSRSRMKSEMEMPRDRDREVKCSKNSRDLSRNETLAGYCYRAFWRNTDHKFKNTDHTVCTPLKTNKDPKLGPIGTPGSQNRDPNNKSWVHELFRIYIWCFVTVC